MAETLRNDSLPPLQRLGAYIDTIKSRMQRDSMRNGCLLGNFTAEANDHSEAIRQRLVEIFGEVQHPSPIACGRPSRPASCSRVSIATTSRPSWSRPCRAPTCYRKRNAARRRSSASSAFCSRSSCGARKRRTQGWQLKSQRWVMPDWLCGRLCIEPIRISVFCLTMQIRTYILALRRALDVGAARKSANEHSGCLDYRRTDRYWSCHRSRLRGGRRADRVSGRRHDAERRWWMSCGHRARSRVSARRRAPRGRGARLD